MLSAHRAALHANDPKLLFDGKYRVLRVSFHSSCDCFHFWFSMIIATESTFISDGDNIIKEKKPWQV